MINRPVQVAALVAILLTGCGTSVIGDGNAHPHVDLVAPDTLVIGEPLTVFGHNFASPEDGYTRLVFDGVYYTDGGSKVLGSFVIAPRRLRSFPEGVAVDNKELPRGTDAIRWNRFGPFQVPFNHDVQEPGVFEGTVQAVNVYQDGSEDADPFPAFFAIRVNPSIAIKRLTPIVIRDGEQEIVDCSSPALRVFGNTPYFLEVEAVGTEPAHFSYTINQGSSYVQTFEHEAQGQADRLGLLEGEELVFAPVPDGVESETAVIAVTVTDAAGREYRTVLPIPVVRPMQLVSDGGRKLAEYYEPVVVHGPIVGAIGTNLNYSETHSESRQQGVSVNISKSFSESHGITASENWSEGIGISTSTSTSASQGVTETEHDSASETYGTGYSHTDSNSVGYSSTDGTTWSTDVSIGGGDGLFSIPGLGASMGRSSSSSQSSSWNATSSDTTSESFSGTYAVGSQSSLSSSTTESTATSNNATYTMGGSEGISENYTVGNSESWGETWSTTSSDSTLLSYSSQVPRGRCAVVYRQTVRFVRQATLVAHDMCGVRSQVADLTFNEWSWSPNIAIADSCVDQKIPPSTQPVAQCFLACD